MLATSVYEIINTYIDGNDVSHGEECRQASPYLSGKLSIFDFLFLDVCQ